MFKQRKNTVIWTAILIAVLLSTNIFAKNDRRNKRFIMQHGRTAYELDALHPQRLEKLVRESIKSFTYMSAYKENSKREKADLETIECWRESVVGYGIEKAEELGIC